MLDQNQFLILLIVVSFLIMGGAAFITREVRAKVWTLGYPTVPYVQHHHDEYRSTHRCSACSGDGGSFHASAPPVVTVAPVVTVPATSSLIPMSAGWSTGASGGSGLLQRDSFVTSHKTKSGAAKPPSHTPPPAEDEGEPPSDEKAPETTGEAEATADPAPTTAKDSFEEPPSPPPAAPISGSDGFRDHHVSLAPFHNQSRFHTSLKSLR